MITILFFAKCSTSLRTPTLKVMSYFLWESIAKLYVGSFLGWRCQTNGESMEEEHNGTLNITLTMGYMVTAVGLVSDRRAVTTAP